MPKFNLRKGTIQWGFQQSRKKVQIMGGGFANGKTANLCLKALQVAECYPGANILLARASYAKLNDSLRKEFYKWIPKHWVERWPTEKDNTMRLKNGTVINFRYVAQKGKQAEDGSTTSNLLSNTYDFIGVDQVEDPEIVFKDFHDLMGRLRGTTPYRPPSGKEDPTMPASGPRWLVLTCNPTRNWVYKELVLPYQHWKRKGVMSDNLMVDALTLEPIIDLFEGSTYENKENLPEDFIAGLENTYKGQMRARFLMGEWAAFEGLVYPHFNSDIHMVPREQILAHLKNEKASYARLQAREGYDFGIVSPSVHLLGTVDSRGRGFIFDGYYRPEFLIEDQAALIPEIRSGYWDLLTFDDPIWADPDVFRRKVIAGHHATGESIKQIFASYNIEMKPASNDIQGGIAKVSAYLAPQKGLINPFSGAPNSPLLFFAQELGWIETEFLNYFWKRNPQGQTIDEPMDKDDHAMDGIKYWTAKLPDPADIVIPKSAQTPGYLKWFEVERDRHGRRVG